MDTHTLLYVIFIVLLISSMGREFYQHKKDKAISLSAALLETVFWIMIATIFGGVIRRLRGGEDTIQYFSGYLLEKTLSIDNLFVMMAIFTSLRIPEKYRYRVLYFGILGAIILRLVFIFLGTALLSLGTRVFAVFGGIVLLTALKMLKEEIQKQKEKKADIPHENTEEHDHSQTKIAKLVKKIIPVHAKIQGHDFFIKENGKRYASALFLCLVVIELSDIMFAFDSIPAILSISQDTFIVFSSNIFAILGLRSLYFVLEAMENKFQYLNYAIIGILGFIGIKMLLNVGGIHIPSFVSLGVIMGGIGIGISTSLRKSKQHQPTK